ncbi:actin-binding protein WASF3-like isoform X1 [Myxocyprinus asiaticus]|uniref:actin-binding protein WASF3-like isoform X1 n=1 Tax=Myxocyprinus asiaticus TaxID=70543 RepID=UPI00222140D2|nr:actin-binding protein WASF3-like isoform X1 [Myxocyprinus asiaticus]XP_051537801.1 actin-binding protein WASF3-like isoform X1 [Myxocyprinus asiaticus]XP_051537802.1 actin-binding protein WASF3-like isoform X1 [Myxocyprinus asiaticus]XP_051537803.1 actin-binding protein WASF3-like isoform X1 [Myxocyprinus asiaticus]XP_051537804.1 actin-binding protein WASF3-like isoform X1 [Myxocyprinus asiaticus]
MPLVKRNIEPRHLCRGVLPDGIGSELECVMNNTLSAIIRQLSSLSKHAEDIFGELFNEANMFCLRTNSLQDRIDRLAVKVTQLDSTIEEVSLQDINMRKAFKSSTIQDQQVVSKSSVPIPVTEMYNLSDKPPPLNILTPYRDDDKEGLKFYTDPSYFFDLWKEKMLQDTEDKRKEKRRQKEQRQCVDGTLQREVKKVRKARNRRQEWNMMAFDKELRPDHRHSHTIHRGGSAEGTMSPEQRFHGQDHIDHGYLSMANHAGHAHTYSGPPPSMAALAAHSHMNMDQDYRAGSMAYRSGTLGRPHQAPPPPPSTNTMNGSMSLPPVDYSVDYMNSGPPPPPPGVIPSAQTAFAMPPMGPVLPPGHLGPMGAGYAPSIPPTSGPTAAPPPPVAPPPPPSASQSITPKWPSVPNEAQPTNDARSDLLAAIRMGIQLKKVQEQQEQQAKREPVGNDVATILSRRIAVEYSESEDESDLEDNDCNAWWCVVDV